MIEDLSNLLFFAETAGIFKFAMKRSRGCLCILGLVASLLLVSCSHKAPATRLDREKWDENALQDRYHAIGTQNSKWDKDAEDALSQTNQ